MKFEEAYWKKEDKNLSIDEITGNFRSNKSFFSSDIKDCLFCPVCQKPNLAFNNASTPYLSTYPNSEHAAGCRLIQDELSPKRADKIVSNPKNKDIIIRQMEYVFLTLFDSSTKTGKSSSKSISFPKSSHSFAKEHKTTSKRFSWKRIDLSFNVDDFDCFKIFYGTVFVKWETDYHTSDGIIEEWHKILMYNKKEKMVCRLEISPRVYSYIPETYKKINNTNCKITFLAKFKNNGKTYRKSSLINSEFLMME